MRDVIEELEGLIAQQTGVRWSVFLAANEAIVIDDHPRMPTIAFGRRDDAEFWSNKYGVLGLPNYGWRVL
ncbi:hypothetical protein C1M53_26660 [Mesorhizobium sp. Pch-S]|nr:hypothetical protein C1M53_26660 [Mesorhizobium sp. Pch-S]